MDTTRLYISVERLTVMGVLNLNSMIYHYLTNTFSSILGYELLSIEIRIISTINNKGTYYFPLTFFEESR